MPVPDFFLNGHSHKRLAVKLGILALGFSLAASMLELLFSKAAKVGFLGLT